ncbi:MAG: CvpA family protein [Rickettsiales bacterium]
MADAGTIHTTINQLDLGVLVVLGLSGLLSFFRGFVREVLSLGAWLGASIITLYTFPRVTEMIEPHIQSKAAAGGIAALGVFIFALIIISMLTGLLVKFLKPSKEIGVLDNIVGLGFGIARGALLMAVAFYAMALVMKKDDYPDWVKQSTSAPYIEKLAHWVASVAPDYLGAPEPDKIITDVPAAKKTIGDTLDGATIPSLQDLQRHMRQENEDK